MVETIATLITVFCGIFSIEWLGTSVHVCGMPSDAFPSIKWEDDEPTRVYIRIV